MGAEKTTEILEFKVEQGDAISEMERLKKTMLGLKEDQKQLNDAYKKGAITQAEYAKELVRIDAVSKKTSSAYNDLQKKITGVQTQTDKLIKSNQQLSDSFKNAAGQINIAGTNVNDLGAKFTSLANPVTATVAIVGALGAAYARSTIGAKDLAFANAQLGNAITIVTNDLASLISSAEDGEGAITKLFNNFLYALGPAGASLAEQSRAVTMAGEILEDLGRDEIRIRGIVSDRLAENQELLTEINDENTKYEDKLLRISDIIGNLRKNQKDLLDINQQELGVLQRKLAGDKENEDLQTAVLDKEREISKIKSDTEKKLQAILRLEDNITEQKEKQTRAEIDKANTLANAQAELELQSKIAADNKAAAENKKLKDDIIATTKRIVSNKSLTETLKDLFDVESLTAGITDESIEANNNLASSIDQEAKEREKNIRNIELTATSLGQLSSIVKKESAAQKAFASGQALVNTYLGATNVLTAKPPIPFPLNLIALAATIGAGLATVAKINGVQFAEGGYTGPGGKYQEAGIVHKGEVVWSQRDVAAVGGPHAADSMRPTYKGYADGGLVGPPAQELTLQDIQAFAASLPAPVVIWSEFNNFEKGVMQKVNFTER